MTDAPKMPFIDLQTQRSRIEGEIETAINRVLAHGQYVMGPEVVQLERALEEFSGARHCISCANGTDALVLALMAEDIGPGDAVFVPAFTFVATAEAVSLRRAVPVFVDIDEDSFNISATSLEQAVVDAERLGLRPRAVIAVDLFGLPADYAAIEMVAEAYGLLVIADAAQSFGASRDGRRVGEVADYTTTSFFPAKPLGCYGDGGAVFTGDDEKAARLRSLRMHGAGGDRYENVRIGVNSRLDSMQAAILLEKLKIFPEEIAERNRVALAYNASLGGLVKTPTPLNSAVSVWAQYTVVPPEGVSRDSIRERLGHAGIPTAVYYPIPLHRQEGYREYPSVREGLPVSDKLSQRVFSLPMHAYLDDAQVTRVADALAAAIRN